MEGLFTIEGAIALVTLTALEIVLGIDNIVFIAVVSSRLSPSQQSRARKIGLAGAMIMRIGLLVALSWIMGLTAELFTVMNHAVSGRDLILLVGGLFLIGKATFEIHEKLELTGEHASSGKAYAKFGSVILQIMTLDIVFSLDSVITAVGMVNNLVIMITAIIVAVGVMMIFADAVSNFIEKHPTLKMLAFSFLLLIGVMLVVEGTGQHVEKGYIYFAMGFSFLVEMLNLRMRRGSEK